MTDTTKRPPICLLGIAGGVAAYKSVAVASKLTQAGWDVHVIMSPAAVQFVTPLTFSAITGRRVHTGLFEPGTSDREDIYPHLYPATEADVCILLPATADLIARVAHGIGDDLLSTAALSLPAHCRRWICPAMNVEMWGQPVVQDNAARLIHYGWRQLGPESGRQACTAVGAGRMTEPDAIVDAVLEDWNTGDTLQGRRILIVSGPTVEAIDPVRFISNHSSGKMGKALALAAVRAGADVTLVSGPVIPTNLPAHPRVTLHKVRSASDMLAEASRHFPDADAIIYVAAVADYTPAEPAEKKQPKGEMDLTIKLKPTPDIAATLCATRRPGQVCVGFALETHDGPEKARAKLQRKNLDAIVLNGVDSFGAETGEFTYIPVTGPLHAWGRLDKSTCAIAILDAITHLLQSGSHPARA